MSLDPTTILQRTPDISVRLDSHNNATITSSSGSFECGPYALIVLQAFAYPTSVSDVFAKLQNWASRPQEMVDLTATVLQLYQAGLLVQENHSTTQLSPDAAGFDSTCTHISLLNDRQRTDSFIKAIHEVVRPGDIVLDLGTGSGILAVTAAKAGARHVYAIESGTFGNAARAMFAANDVSDRITLLQGWSTQLDLPERADVLITETIGNDPFGERILELTFDAVRRMLNPHARILPSNLRVFGLPVTIPNYELEGRTFDTQTLERWKTWYELDFTGLSSTAAKSNQLFYANPHDARTWDILGDPVLLADIDLKENEGIPIDTNVNGVLAKSGLFNGFLIFFELQLSPRTKLSVQPDLVNEDSCWNVPVWILENSFFANAQQRFNVSYRYRSQSNETLLVNKLEVIDAH
jgi:hypothetical protein